MTDTAAGDDESDDGIDGPRIERAVRELLLAIGEEAGPKDGMLSQTFLKAYHHLREKLHHPVEYSADSRHNTARAALTYAELVMADMILVNPQTESGISGVTCFRHISEFLNRDSKIQVLDVGL